MSDYISRDSVCSNQHVFYYPKDGIARNNGYDPADWGIRISDVMDVLAADVRPVVHGEWECADDEDFSQPHVRCSNCGEYHFAWYRKFPYCPNCGADMRPERRTEE